jgi:23S rRNA (cytidine2498-2'-O)-methyltransferase
LNAANLLLLCRAGFEKECAQEIMASAGRMGVDGHVRARPDSGFATFHPNDARLGRDLARGLDFASLVFPRQVIRIGEVISDLPVGDRLPPVVASAKALGSRFCELRIETPDTNDGKALSSLIRPLKPHLERALAAARVAIEDAKAGERLHVFFIGGTACHVGTTIVGNSSPWPMGIPRLRMPRSAPSRSTLKLAEALQEFVGEAALKRRMKPGMRAVDLGAAPGGWTWQLVQRDLIVLAVDNGPMDAALMETGQVKQRREDGFHFRPPEPVDWMVCDMVESPSRIATLAARWIAQGWCSETVFNLKLPMKKRWEEVERCRGIIAGALEGRPYRLRIKHLYHDREEVTAWIANSARP